MERYYLDVQYAYGALLREVINHLDYKREMEWFSIGHENLVV